MYKFNSADIVGLKWAFPESEKIDFVWRNYIDNYHFNDSRGYVYSQISLDDSYNNYLIPAAIFAQDYSTDSWQSVADETVEDHYYASDRGLGIFKSGKDSLDLATQFHVRQDLGGHTHSDRLDFTFSGLGRIWIRKTFGGSQFHPSKYHSMVLVDDQGVALTDLDGDKSRQPASVLNCTYDDDLSKMTGDATYAYSWEWSWWKQFPGNDHPQLGTNGWEAVMETRNDFLPITQSQAHFDLPFYDYPHWHDEGYLERMVKRPHNPMNKVIRNVGMIRGENPFLLITDDIEKDGAIHNYKWQGQIANDLEFDHYDVNLSMTDYKCDIHLKDPNSADNKRLLIRVLENSGFDGSTAPGYIDTIENIDVFTGLPFNANPPIDRRRLIVESTSISPQFKVLLYPYYEGDNLPITNWNSTQDTLEVIFENETKSIRFFESNYSSEDFELIDSGQTNAVSSELTNTLVRISPNPTDLICSIECDAVIKSIELIDLNGRSVNTWNKVNAKTFYMNLENQQKGSYLIKIRLLNNKIFTERLVVQ